MTELEKAVRAYIDSHPNSKMNYPEWDGADAYDAFVAGSEWQAKQSPWISVEERLPDDQCIVMVRDEYGGMCTAYLHGKNSGFITYGEDGCKVFVEITHWMPIPE